MILLQSWYLVCGVVLFKFWFYELVSLHKTRWKNTWCFVSLVFHSALRNPGENAEQLQHVSVLPTRRPLRNQRYFTFTTRIVENVLSPADVLVFSTYLVNQKVDGIPCCSTTSSQIQKTWSLSHFTSVFVTDFSTVPVQYVRYFQIWSSTSG